MSRDRRGSESQPLITEWAPAARVRDSFAEEKNCVKRRLAVSLPPLATLELRDLVFQSGHEARLQLGFIFIDQSEKKKNTNKAAAKPRLLAVMLTFSSFRSVSPTLCQRDRIETERGTVHIW